MKLKLFIILLFAPIAIIPQLNAEGYVLQNKALNVCIRDNGSVSAFVCDGKNIEFRKDSLYCGPSLFLDDSRLNIKLSGQENRSLVFSGGNDSVTVNIRYFLQDRSLAVQITLTNRLSNDLQLFRFMLRLGINTEMDVYPHWNDICFPTMMRCEKNFFWGYLMNPSGSVITVLSPDPVASWNHSYKPYQHRIFTTNLDLMHTMPLPERHPQDLWKLKGGETKKWTIYLQPVAGVDDVKPLAAKVCKAVITDAPLYTAGENDTFRIKLFGDRKKLRMISPDGTTRTLTGSKSLSFVPVKGPGEYKLIAESREGRQSESVFSVRKPWSWYMKAARQNAIGQPQKAGSHTESWYGLFSMFLAEKYFPNRILLDQSLEKFRELYPLMYDKLDLPRKIIVFGNLDLSGRIQNTSCMASLLADIYQVMNDTTYLAMASRMCDFLISKQDIRGAFRSGGHVHYTSVVYIAKSMLEVCRYEKQLADGNNIWQKRYKRHFTGAKRAVDELTESLDNIQTEGEMTYEDGMIACSYTQIAMMAGLTDDQSERDKYVRAAEYLRKGHRCLSQLIIPDSRMNGGSLRYWESQYDILSFPNLMSSPHGWSAWRIYGLFYLYQQTGDPDLINQVFNGLGSCVQLIDPVTGILRWAFCVDPYITGDPGLTGKTGKLSHDEMRGGGLLVRSPLVSGYLNKGVRSDKPVGEEYLDMISGWYKAAPSAWVTGYWEPDGGCCDNDVHEIFKCMEETILTNAFIVEMSEGTLRSYNCRIGYSGNRLEVYPDENIISHVHFNLKHDLQTCIHFSGTTINSDIKSGKMVWINRHPKDYQAN